MTAAYRLKGAGWLLTCVGVALAFYLVSLRVAEERKRVEQVTQRIAAAQRDIRALETEFDTRANLARLEKWNGDTLALAAAGADQYVHDEAALAAIDVHAAPLPGEAKVRTAALVVPAGVPATMMVAAVVPAGTSPAVASAAHPAADPVFAKAAPTPRLDPGLDRSLVRAAAVHLTPLPAQARALARSEEEHAHPAARHRAQVAMLDGKLLSDATLGDLLASARVEAGRRR